MTQRPLAYSALPMLFAPFHTDLGIFTALGRGLGEDDASAGELLQVFFRCQAASFKGAMSFRELRCE